jgi:hypothetical protein
MEQQLATGITGMMAFRIMNVTVQFRFATTTF